MRNQSGSQLTNSCECFLLSRDRPVFSRQVAQNQSDFLTVFSPVTRFARRSFQICLHIFFGRTRTTEFHLQFFPGLSWINAENRRQLFACNRWPTFDRSIYWYFGSMFGSNQYILKIFLFRNAFFWIGKSLSVFWGHLIPILASAFITDLPSRCSRQFPALCAFIESCTSLLFCFPRLKKNFSPL